MIAAIIRWLDERLHLDDLIAPFRHKTVPVHRLTYWYFFGGITLFLFGVQVITGILLMLYYHPSVPQAYADVKDLKFVVSSGMFLRNLHRWSAHAMVLLVFAHMFRVFYRGAYRPPREFNWVIGVILLLITLLLSYTGYLLPWDQLAFWAITVGSNISSAVPVFGDKARFLMLGGHQVNANALLRFYVLHCVILPLAAVLFVAVHMWRIRKDGGLYVRQSEPARESEPQPEVPATDNKEVLVGKR